MKLPYLVVAPTCRQVTKEKTNRKYLSIQQVQCSLKVYHKCSTKIWTCKSHSTTHDVTFILTQNTL